MTPQRVHTVVDFWDGPRGGVADHDGRPHVYRSLFHDLRLQPGAEEHDEDLFLLRPIDDPTFALMLEDWGIWERWLQAFRAGSAPPDSHPALPADRARHDELWPTLLRVLSIEEGDEGVLRARASFDGPLVTWTLVAR